MSTLKSSLAKKDSELNSFAATLHSKKDDYFHLEGKNADMSQSYEKFMAKFEAYHMAVESSKYEAIVDAYKLGYLDCKSGAAPCHPIKYEDVEMFFPEMRLAQGVQINAIHMEAAKGQVVDETAVEEDNAKVGTADEVAADLAKQPAGTAKQMATSNKHVAKLGGAMEGAVDHAKAEEIVDQ
ncbi:PREDICTED: LOC110760952 partial [Prunus dulcis]|uniref:PREDICTED: LOC110760952 partial n=1 Tax=Prunus dulcis TaxID=3755 RepID=A0A5E4G2H5_PRUDU|nr:PREDICTED: LOC110760952 partial [Prunus dulcis]